MSDNFLSFIFIYSVLKLLFIGMIVKVDLAIIDINIAEKMDCSLEALLLTSSNMLFVNFLQLI